MKKLVTLILVMVMFIVCGCVNTPTNPDEPIDDKPVIDDPNGNDSGENDQNNKKKTSTVRVSSVPGGVESYNDAEVFIGETKVPVYQVMVNTVNVWTPNNYKRAKNGVCFIELDGVCEVTVKVNKEIDYSSVLRPLSAKITPIANLEERTLKFKFKSSGEYVLEINNDCHDAIHFFVTNPKEEVSKEGFENIIVFEAGLHNSSNNNLINQNNVVNLKSNTLVIFKQGAVVRARFVANNQSNIKFTGIGVIDGSAFERDASKGTVTVPLEFNYCDNISLNDFTVLDPAGWCVNFYFVTNSQINDIKIISSRSNGDGISLQSCKDIEVDSCFVRSWDDSLVVKNYPHWSDRTKHGQTQNIKFTNCTIWTDLAQSMELGYETVGEVFENISFENITVLHAMHNAVISIHNANNANIKNVTFKDITIEDGKKASSGIGLIDLRILFSTNWSNQHTAPTFLGTVNQVLIENVKVIQATRLGGMIGGCYDNREGFQGDRIIENVEIRNVEVNGKKPTFEDTKIALFDSYLKNFTFTQLDEKVTGSSFIFSQKEEYLNTFLNECSVEIIK